MPLSVEISGFSSNGINASSGVAVSGISTVNSPDVIYAWVATYYGSGVTISGGGLTWNSRISRFGRQTSHGQSFYAIANTTLSNINIWADWGAGNYGSLAVVSIAGANTTTPFDSNAAVPLTVSGSNSVDGVASGVMSTTSADDILIGMLGSNTSGNATAASGWTQLTINSNIGGQSTGTEYLIVAAAQTNAPISFTNVAAQNWVLAGDAIVQATAIAVFIESGPKRQYRRGGFRR